MSAPCRLPLPVVLVVGVREGEQAKQALTSLDECVIGYPIDLPDRTVNPLDAEIHRAPFGFDVAEDAGRVVAGDVLAQGIVQEASRVGPADDDSAVLRENGIRVGAASVPRVACLVGRRLGYLLVIVEASPQEGDQVVHDVSNCVSWPWDIVRTPATLSATHTVSVTRQPSHSRSSWVARWRHWSLTLLH
jgi:hypothetical protein